MGTDLTLVIQVSTPEGWQTVVLPSGRMNETFDRNYLLVALVTGARNEYDIEPIPMDVSSPYHMPDGKVWVCEPFYAWDWADSWYYTDARSLLMAPEWLQEVEGLPVAHRLAQPAMEIHAAIMQALLQFPDATLSDVRVMFSIDS